MRRRSQARNLAACEAYSLVAARTGEPITLGPLRFNADGTVDLARTENVWERATDELLAGLDTEVRLGAKRTLVHEAAELLLLWKRGPIRPNDADDDNDER